MLKTLTTILLGRTARAEQALETQNAALIIEQKLREAEAGHALAKRGLASLLARCKSEKQALAGLEARIADLETRTRDAVKAGRDELARDAAKLLADLENEQAIRRRTLAASEEKAERIRFSVERTHRQLIDLRQGLITARAIEVERRAVKQLKGDLSANSAIREGEAVLQRLLGSADPIEQIEALEDVEAGLSGDAVMDRLAEAGFGKAEKVRAEDVLARFASDAPKSPKSKAG